jgi:hypothetical protein
MLFNGSVDNEFVTVYLSVSCTQIFFFLCVQQFYFDGNELATPRNNLLRKKYSPGVTQ